MYSNIGVYFTKGYLYGAEVTFRRQYIILSCDMCDNVCERPCKKESNLQGYMYTIHFITVFANIHHTRVLYYTDTPLYPVYTLVLAVSRRNPLLYTYSGIVVGKKQNFHFFKLLFKIHFLSLFF